MSASSKKKLRKEQEAAKLTEKQLTAQKEAKKTSLYTTAFVRLTTGPSGTRSGGLRKGQSPCEFLGGLSEFLSR